MFREKGLAHILLIIILLTGILAGVYLIGKTQIFKPKAAGVNIEFLENACTKLLKEGDKILICPKPKIKFTSPLEAGNAKSESLNLVKTAYAAGSGKGYYCLSDTDKIYHKEKVCNPVLGILCFTWLSSHDEEKAENCDIGYECRDSTPDLLNNVVEAKCVVSPKQPSRGNFQPRFIPESASAVQPSLSPATELPARSSSAVSTPAPAVFSAPLVTSQTSRTQTSQTFQAQGSSNNTSSNASSNTSSAGRGGSNVPDNTGAGTTAPNTGTGATNPPPAAARTTAKFRFADERDKLDTALWRKYDAGGTIVEDFTFSNTLGRKAIFAQFMDNQDPPQIIKFDSGQEFTVANIMLISEVTPSPSPSASPRQSSSPVATANPTAVPTAVPIVAPTSIPAAPPKSSVCNVSVDIASWPNCSNEVLIGLPANLRDMLPNEAIINFSNDDLLRLFPKTRLATLPSSRLQSFSNQDLLDMAALVGGTKVFLSNFSCGRIATFAPDIKDLFKEVCSF